MYSSSSFLIGKYKNSYNLRKTLGLPMLWLNTEVTFCIVNFENIAISSDRFIVQPLYIQHFNTGHDVSTLYSPSLSLSPQHVRSRLAVARAFIQMSRAKHTLVPQHTDVNHCLTVRAKLLSLLLHLLWTQARAFIYVKKVVNFFHSLCVCVVHGWRPLEDTASPLAPLLLPTNFNPLRSRFSSVSKPKH